MSVINSLTNKIRSQVGGFQVSVRFKFIGIAAAVLIANALILSGFYELVVARTVVWDYNAAQKQLDSEIVSISDMLTGSYAEMSGTDAQTLCQSGSDLNRVLSDLAKDEKAEITLEDENGNRLYYAAYTEKFNTSTQSAHIVTICGRPYLLRMNKMVYLKRLADNNEAKSLVWAEICLVFLLLLGASGLVYVSYIKPLEGLERNMRLFKSGSRAERTERGDEIGRLQNSFVDLTERIDDERSKQSTIIASISHDIKTPLTSVMGYAERIKKGGLSEERTTRYVDTIYKKSIAIRDLVNEFDDYISSNQRQHYSPVDISAQDVIKALRDDYTDDLSSQGVHFDVECLCGDAPLFLDENKIRRVFGNLISNALKHMETEPKCICVTCDEEDDGQYEFVRFTVTDNGTGVDEKVLDRIFEPLFTTDAGRSVAGLGLAICREAIECHGGSIWAENIPSGGLKVMFTLPIKQIEED